MPATVPASFTKTIWVCEGEGAVINCTIVGIKAARNTTTRRRMLVMMKLRWVMRFLYSRPIIRPILRRLCWAAAPPELTVTAPCSWMLRSCTGVSTGCRGIISFLFFYAESSVDGASGSAIAPTCSIKMSVSDGSVSSKRLMMPPCSSAASTIRLGLKFTWICISI